MLLNVLLSVFASATVAHAQVPVIKIDGSSTVFPITEAMAEEFQTSKKGAVRVTVGISGTGGGFKKFCRLVQIEQVLLNLLNNSFDAIQTLEEKWIRVEIKSDANNVEWHVIDSGRGIPEDVAEKMMLPFFTTKEVGKGTGLGLSISSGIMRSHMGELLIEKNAEHTTFVIRIPRLQET
jgi:C4-dicarboxylate-specific signal transduction histidine kinase